ncbi:MAG: hypothetical protein D6776_05760, partial [Planctomycetota bacterium]
MPPAPPPPRCRRRPRVSARGLALLVFGLVLAPPVARAQGLATLGRDDPIEVLLRRADELASAGRSEQALEALLRVEDRAAQLRHDQPALRPVHVDARGIARGVWAAVRRRVLTLGPGALQRYRSRRDPELAARLRALPAAGQDLAALRETVQRYLLATGGLEALARLGDLELERGALEAAAGAYARLLRGGDDLPPVPAPLRERAGARLAHLRALAARPGIVAPLATPGGRADRAGERPTVPLPGAVRFVGRVPGDDDRDALVPGYRRAGRTLAPYLLPVARDDEILLTDGAGVAALSADDGRVSWYTAASDPEDRRARAPIPDRPFALPKAVCARGAIVFAALQRGLPPAGYEELQGEEQARLARNGRLVALRDDAEGRPLWDAATRAELERLSRQALAISPPLAVDDLVLHTVALPEGGGVQVELLALEQASGALRYRSFIASGRPDNFLLAAALPAAPSVAQGVVYVSTGVGAIAALDLATGDPRWIARYPTHPPDAFPRIVDGGYRLRLAAPVVRDGVVCVAATDTPALLGFDAETGALRWRLARAGLRWPVGVANGRWIVAGGGRVLAIEPGTGRVAWRTALRAGERLVGRGVAGRDRIVLPSTDHFVVLDARTGARDPRPHHYGPGQRWAGNLTVARGRLVAVTADGRAVGFEPLAAEPAPAAARDTSWAEELAAAELLWRLGREDAALGRLRAALERLAAVERVGGEQRRPLSAGASAPRMHAHRLALAIAESALGAGRLDRARAAFALAATDPGAAPLGARLAEALLSAKRFEPALAVLRALAGLPAELELPVDDTLRVPLGPWLRFEIEALRARPEAQRAIEAYDRAAAEAAARLGADATPQALERWCDRWPASRAEAQVLERLAKAYERLGRGAAVVEVLGRLARRPGDPERAAVIAAERIGWLVRLQRHTEARAALRHGIERFGAQPLPDGTPWRRWAETQLAALGTARPELPGGAGGGERLTVSFHTPTDLDEPELHVLAEADLPGGLPEGRWLAVGEHRIALRETETGAPVWSRRFTASIRRERLARVGETLVVFTGEPFAS